MERTRKKMQNHRKIIWLLTGLTVALCAINPAVCSSDEGFIGLPHNSEQTAQSRPTEQTAASSCAKIRVILTAVFLRLLAEAQGDFLRQ